MAAQSKEMKLANQKIGSLLLELALPMILAEIITLLYNMVDRVYIGHMENSAYTMAGIGLCAPLVMIITAVARLFGQGGAPLSSICMGQKNYEEAEKIMGNSLFYILVSSVIITIGSILYAEPIMRLFGASDNTISYAVDYMIIYCAGTVFLEIAFGMVLFVNTQGYTNMGMAVMVVGAVLNIALDPLFIFTFDMGVRGAALATILSQAVSAIMVMAFLMSKKSTLKIRLPYLKPDWKITKRILGLGITPFFQGTTEGLVNICFNTQLLAYGGDLAVSSLTVIMSLYQIVQLPLQGIALGGQPIISYNFGARNFDRVKKTINLTLIVNVIFSTLMTILMMVIPSVFVQIFTNEPDLVKISSELMPIYIAGGLLTGVFCTYQTSYNALGKGFYAFAFAFIRKIILLIPLLYIFPAILPWGAAAVMLAEPVSDLAVSVANGIYFRSFSRNHLSEDSRIGIE